MSATTLLVPRKRESAARQEPEEGAYAQAAGNVFEARAAAVRAARNPLLEAAGPLLRVLADIPDSGSIEGTEAFHKLLIHEMREFQHICEMADIRREHVVAARYCLCTALDEAVSKTPWDYNLLTGQSMLVLFHNETYGGEKFFLLLGRMSLEPAEHVNVLELLYRILALGFEGRYALAPDGQRQLENIQRRLLSVLEASREAPPDVLFHEWRGDYPGRSRMSLRYAPLWLTAALCALALAGAWWHFSSDLGARRDNLHAFAMELVREKSPAAPADVFPPETITADMIKSWFSAKDMVEVRETPASIAISIPGAALFGSGQFALSKAMQPILDKIGANLKPLNRNVLVVGHTDNVPVRPGAKFASNQELSEKRAGVLRDYFNKFRLPIKVEAVGKGESEPLDDNSAPEGRARNRRVDIHIAKRANQNLAADVAALAPKAAKAPDARSSAQDAPRPTAPKTANDAAPPAAQTASSAPKGALGAASGPLPGADAPPAPQIAPPSPTPPAATPPAATASPAAGAVVVPEGHPLAPGAPAEPARPDPAPAPPKPASAPQEVWAAEIKAGRAAVAEKGNTLRFTLSADYMFKGKTADLAPAGRAALDKLALYPAASKGGMNISAHTDDKPVWNERYSSAMDLSQKQARAVRDYLGEKGLDLKKVTAVGRGSTMPLVESADNKARTKNRRVEILIVGR